MSRLARAAARDRKRKSRDAIGGRKAAQWRARLRLARRLMRDAITAAEITTY